MNTHQCPQWTIPLRQTIDKKALAKNKQAQRDDGFTPMSTIREGKEPRSDSSLTSQQREVETLRLHNQKLLQQRDEAFQALEESLASAGTEKSYRSQSQPHSQPQSHTDILKQTISDLEKHNTVLSERCKTLSAWAEQHRIATEKSKEAHRKAKDDLTSLRSEHAAALQALAGDQGSPHSTAKLKSNCDSLTEALGAIDQQHVLLQKEHADLRSKHSKLETDHAQLKAAHKESCEGLSKALANADKQYSALQRQHAEGNKQQELALQQSTAENRGLKAESEMLCTELANYKARLQSAEKELASHRDTLKAARDRATDAERTVQSILGVKALLKNAPIPTGLLSKVSGVLQSSVDVLRLADGSKAEQTRLCASQVATALSGLDEEVSTLAAESGAWLAKREVILRPQSQAA
jgi:hypothetical protein